MAISTIDNNGVNLGQLGNRNMVTNGNFAVWQRGTSFSSSGYGADRWDYGTSGGAGVHSRQTFTGSDIDTFGTQYFHRLAVSVGANNQGMSTTLEDLSRFAGKTFTLSFYAKGTNPAGGHLTTLIGGETGSGGSGDWEVGGTNEIVLSSSWQKFTVTMTFPSMNGRTLGTSSYLYVYPARQPSDDNTTNAWTMDMSQVQLEVGDTATPFEHRSYGEELAKCQRYYWEAVAPSQGTLGRMSYIAASTGGLELLPMYPVPMRASPSVSLTNPTGGWQAYRFSGAGGGHSMQGSLGGYNLNSFSGGHMWWDVNSGSPFTVGFTGRVAAISSSGAFKFDAEL